jgi:hypothetical protein
LLKSGGGRFDLSLAVLPIPGTHFTQVSVGSGTTDDRLGVRSLCRGP